MARFGGDEFVVLCEDLDERGAGGRAGRARRLAAFAEPFALSRAEVVGVGEHRDRGHQPLDGAGLEPAARRRRRDVPRQASRRRAATSCSTKRMHTQAVSRLLTERALRHALDHDELRVLFQPQFDLATNERVGVEALLRWEHPVRGLVLAG